MAGPTKLAPEIKLEADVPGGGDERVYADSRKFPTPGADPSSTRSREEGYKHWMDKAKAKDFEGGAVAHGVLGAQAGGPGGLG